MEANEKWSFDDFDLEVISEDELSETINGGGGWSGYSATNTLTITGATPSIYSAFTGFSANNCGANTCTEAGCC